MMRSLSCRSCGRGFRRPSGQEQDHHRRPTTELIADSFSMREIPRLVLSMVGQRARIFELLNPINFLHASELLVKTIREEEEKREQMQQQIEAELKKLKRGARPASSAAIARGLDVPGPAAPERAGGNRAVCPEAVHGPGAHQKRPENADQREQPLQGRDFEAHHRLTAGMISRTAPADDPGNPRWGKGVFRRHFSSCPRHIQKDCQCRE